ncbi:MAG TPA: hypothetical protein VNL13_00160 [Sulfolobales archaeon]|nr:hypothetical protein [Sulfolobales archaeon]
MPVVNMGVISNNNPKVVMKILKDHYPDLVRDIPNIDISVKGYRDLGVYEVKVGSRIMGITFTDTLHLVIRIEGDSVIYESLEPDRFKAIFRVSEESGRTRIDAEVSYNPPLRVPFKKAAERVVEDMIRRFLEKFLQNIDLIASIATLREESEDSGKELVAKEATAKGEAEKSRAVEIGRTITEPQVAVAASQADGTSCKTCLLYEASVDMCTYFMKKIEDSEKPLCKGEKYIRASV